jgi:hypothetical protein
VTAGSNKVAFALGGLGGFNGHGVGFLQAARELGVKPAIITCTSGMIGWTAEWLDNQDLLPKLETQIRESNKFPEPFDWLNSLYIVAFGDPGIFRPAVQEYWQRWLTPMLPGAFTPKPDKAALNRYLKSMLDRMLPAQVYVPLRPRETVERIARIFNSSQTPVAFNSLHPKTGQAYLHLNDAACDFLGVQYGEVGGEEKCQRITPEAVAGALWLYFYGFGHKDNPHGLVDGAYNRQFIIRELTDVDRIYAVRPMNTKWIGNLPENYFEIQDFTTELWFNSAYAAEVGQMALINKLIDQGKLTDPKFRKIELVEVQVEKQYGYFDFFVEETEVYERSYHKSKQILTEKELNAPVIAVPVTVVEAPVSAHIPVPEAEADMPAEPIAVEPIAVEPSGDEATDTPVRRGRRTRAVAG